MEIEARNMTWTAQKKEIEIDSEMGGQTSGLATRYWYPYCERNCHLAAGSRVE